MRLRLVLACALVLSLLVSATPSQASKADQSGLKKSENRQSLKTNGKWQTLEFDGSNAWTLNGDRTLWSAQAHVYCQKKPKYIKMRLARVKSNGKIDTTGTTTWTLGKNSTTKWQGSFLWATRSKSPMVVQIKVKGGKGCYSPLREFKYWQPIGGFPDTVLVPMNVPELPVLP
jgi:FtsP/CotA-like multicopper oxidase with cupredoxin domain